MEYGGCLKQPPHSNNTSWLRAQVEYVGDPNWNKKWVECGGFWFFEVWSHCVASLGLRTARGFNQYGERFFFHHLSMCDNSYQQHLFIWKSFLGKDGLKRKEGQKNVYFKSIHLTYSKRPYNQILGVKNAVFGIFKFLVVTPRKKCFLVPPDVGKLYSFIMKVLIILWLLYRQIFFQKVYFR